jgi:hypothetical protein
MSEQPKSNTSSQKDFSKNIISGHEIISEEENKKYFLQFINKNDLIKIILTEKDIFPYKTYELSTSLDELKPKNEYFSSFETTKELIEELNNPQSTINFSLIKKQANVLELFFIFPIEGEDNTMEIELTANSINDREIFRQLFEKYKSIKQEQDEDLMQLKNRINVIEDILSNIQEEQKEQERLEKEKLEKERLEKERLEKEMENEEHIKEEQNVNDDVKKNEKIKKKGEVVVESKKNQVNENKYSNKGSKKGFQKEKDKEKNIKKEKPEKKKKENNINNNKKKIKLFLE